MICERCHGAGEVLNFSLPEPCPECNGCGLAHCCDGMREQPEGNDDIVSVGLRDVQ